MTSVVIVVKRWAANEGWALDAGFAQAAAREVPVASSLCRVYRAAQTKDVNMLGVDFDVLRAEISMEQVLNQLNFEPTARSGNQWHGSCPVHGSTSPRSRSFSVNLSTGRYFCHKRRSHGNALELWAAARNLRLYEAALDLAARWAETFPGSNAAEAQSGTEEKRHRYFVNQERTLPSRKI